MHSPFLKGYISACVWHKSLWKDTEMWVLRVPWGGELGQLGLWVVVTFRCKP